MANLMPLNTPVDKAHKVTGMLLRLVEKQREVKLSDARITPTYPQLVHRLELLFHHQKAINHFTSRLSIFNTVSTFTNYIHNKQLSRRILHSQFQILSLSGTVDKLQDEVKDLKLEVEHQNSAIERLKGELKSFKRVFEDAVKFYRQELETHRLVLCTQQSAINSLRTSTHYRLFLLDTTLFLVSYTITVLPFFTLLLHLLTLPVNHRNREKWKGLARALVIWYLMRRGRVLLRSWGLYADARNGWKEYLKLGGVEWVVGLRRLLNGMINCHGSNVHAIGGGNNGVDDLLDQLCKTKNPLDGLKRELVKDVENNADDRCGSIEGGRDPQ